MTDALRIFISYRREDGGAQARWLYWQLAERLPAKVFLDLESISAGTNFESSLENAVDSCDVLLALIGQKWKGGSEGSFRVQLDDDFVHRELARALSRGTPVIPVLLDGTTMPPPVDLPSDLRELSFRQALPLAKQTLLSDVARLSREISTYLKEERPEGQETLASDLAERIRERQKNARDSEEAARVLQLRGAGLRPEFVVQEGHFSPVHAVAYHPNERWVASGGSDHTIRIWEVASGKLIFVLPGHPVSVRALAFSPDGKVLASGGYDRTVRVWDCQTGVQLRCFEGHTNETNSIVFSRNGKAILAAGGDVRLWEIETGRMLRNYGEGWYASFSPDGALIATPFYDGVLRLWNAETADLIRTLQVGTRNSGLILFAIFSPDGRTVLTACAGDSFVGFWDLESGTCTKRTETDFASHGVRSAALSPDGRCLAVSDSEQGFQLWNIESNRMDYESTGNDYPLVDSIAFSARSDLVACANRHNTVTLTDRRGLAVRTFAGSTRESTSVGIAPDRNTIVVAGGSAATVWDARHRQRICELDASQFRAARFSTDCNFVVLKSISNPGGTLFETTGRKIAEFEIGDHLGEMAFSADSEMIATVRDSVEIMRTRTGRRVQKIRVPESQIRSVAFNPRDGQIATGCADGLIRFWDPETGTKKFELKGYPSEVVCLDFSPDGGILASGSHSGYLLLWDIPGARLIGGFGEPSSPVQRLRVSPDGRTIASQNYNEEAIKLWNSRDGSPIRTIANCSGVEYFEFTGDSKALSVTRYSSSQGSRLSLISASTGAELATLLAWPDNDWIVYQSAGCYTSPQAEPARISWRIGEEVYQCASLHDEFCRPALLEEAE